MSMSPIFFHVWSICCNVNHIITIIIDIWVEWSNSTETTYIGIYLYVPIFPANTSSRITVFSLFYPENRSASDQIHFCLLSCVLMVYLYWKLLFFPLLALGWMMKIMTILVHFFLYKKTEFSVELLAWLFSPDYS